ncbi:hypothetical protein CU102_24565 [Phyllobacterium brassicacearum]|uniref:Copper resistance protein D domain-containing protein n=1 Tax=Phyllobacterium brassicacearum TaxID=314235 RepID=A0A2P7B8Z8_9HYPH|nr:hypothetical protein [Phyllobacterium brassicacearum]PSH62919.1 hypothetical protein CU102_24565 [Phyllobacterium brassicacearum]TDQ13668.1 hypothetical protein DEV91_14027 [Phyllobacterium brassicacearum]
MQQALMIALSLHILAATFWAGSTFALARTSGSGGEQLFGPQMGAAAVAVLTGAYLWNVLHEGSFGTMEQWLTVGAACALLALAIQAVVAGGALRKLRRSGNDDFAAHFRIVVAHRVAAVLLVGATVSMAAARYA